MRNILTVTTSTLMGNYEIEKYYGYISINFVTGANFLRDWFAAVSYTHLSINCIFHSCS